MIYSETGKTWSNWAGTSTSRPEKIWYPKSIVEVKELVKEARCNDKKIRVVGAGHSFTKLVQTDSWLISLDHLTGVEAFHEDTVSVFAGTRLFQLGEELARLGYAQENLGDVNVQSIAGALSTGTHGTGIQFGNIATQVTELTIVLASGEIIELSREKDDELFKAALVSFGTFGIVVKATLRIIKTPLYHYVSDKVPFPKLMKELDLYIQSNRHFEFFLFPYSDNVQVKTMNIAEGKPQSLTVHRINNLITENYLFYLISEVCRKFPKTSSFFSRLSANVISKTSILAESHQLFATPRKVRFREMEYCIPIEHFAEAIQRVYAKIKEKKYHVHFPIECRTVKADDIWLSPSYQRESAFIAFHMYKGMPHEEYFADMEAIMDEYGGRPHWGKMHQKKVSELKILYPKLAEFLKIRQEFDRDGLFLNEYLQDLIEDFNKSKAL